MQNYIKAYSIFFSALFWVNFLFAQIPIAENALIDSLEIFSSDELDLIYQNTKSFPNQSELSIAMIKNGRAQFIGFKRSQDTIKSVENHHSLFEIGSITKVFTSTLLSSLEEEQILNLEDSISHFLGDNLKSGHNITLKQLANHTSGLPRLPTNLNLLTIDPNNPYKAYDEEKLKDYFTNAIDLSQKPGTHYEYSNLGAGTLGYILTLVTETSYEDMLQTRIFTKYGMSNSTTQRSRIRNKIVQGLNPNGEATSNWDFDVLVGAGGLLSSTEDLSKFALAQFDKENHELLQTQQTTFILDDNTKIALGWHITRKNDKELIWHNGGTGGYSSSIVLDTENHLGIILLSNVSAFHPEMRNIDQLSFQLMASAMKK